MQFFVLGRWSRKRETAVSYNVTGICVRADNYRVNQWIKTR